ncbi:MAG: hypothetical protein IJR55_05660 [Clostridia bacterium]|nr:hypothetical protein [Clostridia bacterium]
MKSKLTFSVIILLVLSIMVSACGTVKQTRDKSGKYFLNENSEAVIDDVVFSSEKSTADNNRVFYEIFVGSFSDSNGDGIGDIRGIINRMDYLNDGNDSSGTSLGIEGIWLTPIFKSPSYHKYDVTDYYTIDPQFGTADDLKELISLCHERNVKIIIDLPINHTGYLNQWFISFLNAHRQGDTESKYYNYYCYYSAGESAPAGRSYSQLSGTNDYYECNFSGDMPELNFDNPNVRQEVLDIAKYYLDMGIDGFRFDAAKYVYFGDNKKSVDFWEEYIGKLREIKNDIYVVGEVWDGAGIIEMYENVMNCFDFTASQVNGIIAETAKAGNVNNFTKYVNSYVSRKKSAETDPAIIPFVSNHDMDRAAGYLTVAGGAMKVAANLYILSAGSPFIYYGEELGMRGSRGGANTDANRRLAMLWGDGDTVKDPVGATYGTSSQIDTTAKDQSADGDSLYSYYKRLIMIRKANPEICRGEYKAVNFTGMKLGGFISTYEEKSVFVIHNTSKSSVTVDISSFTDIDFTSLAAVIGVEDASLDGTTLTVGGQTSVVIR